MERSIHDTIDLAFLANRLGAEGKISRDALVLLLDFSKAYDSLDRESLYDSLRWHGMPEAFILFIKELHSGTTARFRANVHLSQSIDIENGIRQGCPLAPLLFILALDTLFAAILADRQLQGITLRTTKGWYRIPIAGYADDVALYLNGPEEEGRYIEILTAFGEASGLKLNTNKFVAVALHPRGPSRQHSSMQIKCKSRTDPTRYLGIQLASLMMESSVWLHTIVVIQQRLVFVGQKTTDPFQRARLLQAIACPKVLFVARHIWPSLRSLAAIEAAFHHFL